MLDLELTGKVAIVTGGSDGLGRATVARLASEGVKVAATDSCKQAHYLPAILGFETWLGTTEQCVDAALTGRWRGGLA